MFTREDIRSLLHQQIWEDFDKPYDAELLPADIPTFLVQVAGEQRVYKLTTIGGEKCFMSCSYDEYKEVANEYSSYY